MPLRNAVIEHRTGLVIGDQGSLFRWPLNRTDNQLPALSDDRRNPSPDQMTGSKSPRKYSSLKSPLIRKVENAIAINAVPVSAKVTA